MVSYLKTICFCLEYKFNFQKANVYNRDTLGLPYDFFSIMHYGKYDFSKNKLPTIITKDPTYEELIGRHHTNMTQIVCIFDIGRFYF